MPWAQFLLWHGSQARGGHCDPRHHAAKCKYYDLCKTKVKKREFIYTVTVGSTCRINLKQLMIQSPVQSSQRTVPESRQGRTDKQLWLRQASGLLALRLLCICFLQVFLEGCLVLLWSLLAGSTFTSRNSQSFGYLIRDPWRRWNKDTVKHIKVTTDFFSLIL